MDRRRRKWHLEHRCKTQGRQILLFFIDEVAKRVSDAQQPAWSQKHYVSIRLGNAIWLYLNTRANQLNLLIPVPPGRWKSESLAKRLHIAEASKDNSLADKLSAPTSVHVYKRKGYERLEFFIKDEKLPKADEFWKVLTETHDDFLKGW